MFSLTEAWIRYRLHRAIGPSAKPEHVGQWAAPSDGGFSRHTFISIAPLYFAALFPSIECARRFRENRELDWPPLCCACGQPAQATLDYVGPGWFDTRATAIRGIPHCPTHISKAKGNALVHVEVCDSRGPLESMKLYAASRTFLESFIDRLESSPMLPPWDAFQWSHPWYARFNQGLEQVYVAVFAHMFARLGSDGQEQYLNVVGADELWRHWSRGESVDTPPKEQLWEQA